MNNLTVWMFW